MCLSVDNLPVTQPFPMLVPELANHCGHDQHQYLVCHHKSYHVDVHALIRQPI